MKTTDQINSPEPAARQEKIGRLPKDAGQEVIRILIVEDDPDISSLLSYTLERAHFKTTAAADCSSAWQIMLVNAYPLRTRMATN